MPRRPSEVQFRVHSVSRTAPIANPIVRVGFRLLKGRERRAFLDSTRERMRIFVALTLARDGDASQPVRDAAAQITARPSDEADVAHEQLAQQLRRPR